MGDLKVAFVEWSTKVPLWTYEGRPSYAYDTSSIVDATAFGACATAMEGCLVGVRPFKEADKLDDLVAFLNTRDVVYVATRWNWASTLEVVRQLTPFTILGFGMTLDELRGGCQQPGEYEALMDLCNAVNLVASFSEDFVPYLQIMSQRPVEYLPMCYPYSYVRDTFRIPRREPPIILIPGVVWNAEPGGRRDDLMSATLAHELARVRDVSLVMSDRKVHRSECQQPTELPIIVRDRVTQTTVRDRTILHPPLSWHEFLRAAQGAAISIHCDWIWTTGRMAADMAALGIPHIGGNSDHTKHLFPELCFDEFEVDHMLDRANMILDSPQLGQQIIALADLWGEQLDYSNWRSWFERLVETYRPSTA